MALYAALLYYPENRYWTGPQEAEYSPAYGEFGAAAGVAGVLRGGEALHPTAPATTITVDRRPGWRHSTRSPGWINPISGMRLEATRCAASSGCRRPVTSSAWPPTSPPPNRSSGYSCGGSTLCARTSTSARETSSSRRRASRS